MNQDRAKHLKIIIDHLANGGSMDDVQEQHLDGGWKNVEGGIIASLNPQFTYRLKPQPLEMWVLEYPTGFGGLYESRDAAASAPITGCIATRRVTVHPEDE